jgi:leader peptidase (prepilin peptidase)/N-methyltransferase
MTAGLFVLCILLIAACIFDIKRKQIPVYMPAAGAAAGLMLSFLGASISPGDALTGFLAGGVLAFAAYFLSKKSIGAGDAMITACAGLFLGLQDTISVVVICAGLTGLTGLVLIALRVLELKSTIPFSPFLLAGVILTILLR